jgi:beta-glucanase (GH16 family)
MIWRIKDLFVNLFLKTRLWFYLNFKPSKFKNINNPIEKNGWDLTFNDEFNDGKLNRDVWRTDNYFGLRFHPGNITEKGTAPDVYFDDNCFEFTDTTIKQVSKKEVTTIEYVDWDGKNWGIYNIPYKVGMLDNSKVFSQKYGYFEIRSKVTSEPGSWPAFWMVSTEFYPPEIDIYEIYTGRKGGAKSFTSTFHWKERPDESLDKKMKPSKHWTMDNSEDFHTYAVEWSEKGFKIYYDNILVRVYSNPEVIRFYQFPMHIIINNSIHMDQGHENAKYPNYHEIDYVRAYKRKK